MTPDEGAAAMKEHDVKHYEFVPDDTIEIEPGKVLHRIRATTHIEVHGVKPGDLGGYIETHENLGGQAWVSGNAWARRRPESVFDKNNSRHETALAQSQPSPQSSVFALG